VRFRETLRKSWPVLVSYGVFSIWGVGCLVASLVLTSGGFGVGPGDAGALFGVLVATVVGHIGGNLLGLMGLRMLPVTLLFFALFLLASLSGVAIGAFALFLFVAIFSALGGYLGVASRLDVVAAWYPLVFAIGGAVTWMNRHAALAKYASGDKHGVWDPFAMICLGGAVFFMLVFLATRHALGLTVWQEVGRSATAAPGDPVIVARPGRGSLLVLSIFTVVVLGMTALVSPYLFRTREPDEKGEHGSSGSSGSSGEASEDPNNPSGTSSGSGQSSSGGKKKPAKGKKAQRGHGSSGGGGEGESSSGTSGKSSKTKRKTTKRSSSSGGGGGASSGSGGGGGEGPGDAGAGNDSDDEDNEDPLGDPDGEGAANTAGQALDLGLKLFLGLLAFALLLLFFLFGVWPPIRRSFLLKHLEHPRWPVPPTARVMNLWRRALAVLALIEVEPEPGETPCDFARRAELVVGNLLGTPSPGLRDAAAIIEKIDYAGRGLGAGDEETVRKAVMAFVHTVEPRIDGTKKFRAGWGPAPEVES
jgi:hypothetical protein